MFRLVLVALSLATPTTVLAHDWNGLAIDSNGHLYSIDAEDGQVWRIDRDGKSTVFLPGSEDAKTCRHPHHIVIDLRGHFWIPSG